MMNWESWVVLICSVISVLCKLGTAYFDVEQSAEDSVKINREQRRHPNGNVPAQKFKRVSVKGRQKQGRGRAVRGW